jgi:hypothetical protein
LPFETSLHECHRVNEMWGSPDLWAQVVNFVRIIV